MSHVLVKAGVLLIVYAACLYIGRLLRYKLLVKQTGVVDLGFLGQERPDHKKIKGTAVICGGSIGGLLTARVCHDHFRHVVLVEPEAWLATEDAWTTCAWEQQHNRSRIMQYRSLQGIQVFGFLGLKKLFPNIENECIASGIRVVAGDFKTSIWGNWTQTPYAEYNNDLPKTMFAGRQGLETLLRRLTIGQKHYPHIEQLIGSVIDVQADPENYSRLHSVTVRTNGGIKSIHAALVIDCTGPARAGIKWLERAGYGFAEQYPKGKVPIDQLKISYDQKMRYSTLEFKVTAELAERLPIPGGFKNAAAIYNCLTDSQVDRNSIFAQRIEGDRIQVCCGAWGDVVLPKTLEGVKYYVQSMVTEKPIPSWFFEFLEMLKELEDTMTYSAVHVPLTSYVLFHKAVNLPSNWIALGDSVMTVNPIFGQGCSKVVLGVISLNTLLCSGMVASTSRSKEKAPQSLPSDFASKFFEIQRAKIEPIWLGTKTLDYGYDTTVPIPGETLSTGAFIRWYIRRLHILAFKDKQAGSSLWHIKMFLAPPIDNFQFRLMIKVLWSVVVNPTAFRSSRNNL